MDVTLVLPRKPADIKFIQVIKKYRDKSGDVGEKKFIIRREMVMNALRWLKKYNRHYDDIIIAKENLDWMNSNDEAEIPSETNQMFDYETESEMKLHWNDHLVNGIQQRDDGPAKTQVVDVEEASDDITYRFQGAISNQFSAEPTKKDDGIIEKMHDMAITASQKGNDTFCPFATTSQKTTTDIPHITQEESKKMRTRKTIIL